MGVVKNGEDKMIALHSEKWRYSAQSYGKWKTLRYSAKEEEELDEIVMSVMIDINECFEGTVVQWKRSGEDEER